MIKYTFLVGKNGKGLILEFLAIYPWTNQKPQTN